MNHLVPLPTTSSGSLVFQQSNIWQTLFWHYLLMLKVGKVFDNLLKFKPISLPERCQEPISSCRSQYPQISSCFLAWEAFSPRYFVPLRGADWLEGGGELAGVQQTMRCDWQLDWSHGGPSQPSDRQQASVNLCFKTSYPALPALLKLQS